MLNQPMEPRHAAEYTFAGFEIATCSRPENSNVVVVASMRRAAETYSRWLFQDRPLGSEEPEPQQETYVQTVAEARQPERWPGVQEALRAPVERVALLNRFAAPEAQDAARVAFDLSAHQEIPLALQCPGQPPKDRQAADFRAAATVQGEEEGPPPRPAAARRALGPEGAPRALLPCCFLSSAAVLGAQALRAEPGERVLELCAGPGAKALVLATQLFGSAQQAADPAAALEQAGAEAGLLASGPNAQSGAGGLLVCNEPNRTRGAVLESVLSSFLPEDLLGKGGRVVVTRAEASSKVPPALKRYAPFDKVLVDPPCTAARAKAKARGAEEPDAAAARGHAELAEELLRCAGALVRPGGLIVYCTSSLMEAENDEAVRKFVRRSGQDFRVEPGADDEPVAGAEQTALGTILLPDQGTLHGPLYFARLRRAGA